MQFLRGKYIYLGFSQVNEKVLSQIYVFVEKVNTYAFIVIDYSLPCRPGILTAYE